MRADIGNSSPRLRAFLPVGILLGLGLGACQQKMSQEGRVRPFEPVAFFPDRSSARVPVPGTVAREDPVRAVISTPPKTTLALLQRGQQRYEIYCAPCHGLTGAGNGPIVQRGFLPPPSYHIERLRSAPPSYLFEVITSGFGAMYPYADRVPVPDRWAIVAYIRALQRSQNTRVWTLTEAERAQLEKESGQ